MEKLAAITYPICSVIVAAFGVFACVFMFIRQRRNAKADSTEFFLTARRSVVSVRCGCTDTVVDERP